MEEKEREIERWNGSRERAAGEEVGGGTKFEGRKKEGGRNRGKERRKEVEIEGEIVQEIMEIEWWRDWRQEERDAMRKGEREREEKGEVEIICVRKMSKSQIIVIISCEFFTLLLAVISATASLQDSTKYPSCS